MSDTGAQEYVEDVDVDVDEINDELDEHERERAFFGDEEYTILTHIEEEEEKDVMS